MGLMRNIPDAHPLYKLLRPHMRYTMAINSKARESLLGPKGVIAALFAVGHEGQNELFRRAGKKYSVHWSNIKHNTKARCVDDRTKLPFYHYRDDGIKIWDALEEYVKNIIDLFYSDDATVSGDKELQNFSRDVHENGFPGCGENDVNGHDFPASIPTKNKLVEICTLIMFTGSAQHAAVNFGQYTYYSFIPNAPLVLHQPPPAQKGNLTQLELLKAMPNMKETDLAIILANLLSTHSPDEVAIIIIQFN